MRGKKDKILVLVMSCNLPQYKEKEEDIRQTWGKDILEKKYDNIDLWFFTAGEHDMIDVEKHKIYTKCSDLRDRTFQKLMKTIYNVEANRIEYDWILRVNTSTYINIELIDKILQHSPSEEWIYAGTMFCQPWILNKMPFLSGEYLIISRAHVEVLKKFYKTNKAYFDKLENDPRTNTKWVCDDGWITTCFAKAYKAESDFFELSKRVHAAGIAFWTRDILPDDQGNADPECKEIAWSPATCFKTMLEEDPDLDKNPIHQKLDHNKLYGIHRIVQRYKPEDLEEWYKWYILNVYDKWCYPYDHIVKSQKTKRAMYYRITKRQMVKWYNDYKKHKKI
jgi:hypothetical protein